MTEISVIYQGQTYIVPLTINANAFFVESESGTPITVSAGTAANLFGAEKAVLLLEDLHNGENIDQIYSAWNAAIASAGEAITLKALLNAVGGVGGAVISAALSDGLTIGAVAPGAIDAIASAAEGATPSAIDLVLVSAMISNAKTILTYADEVYQSFILLPRDPIPFQSIESTVNNTLLAMNLGSVATDAAENIPGVNDSLEDDLIDFVSSFLSPFIDLANEAGSILNGVGSSLETNILGAAGPLGDGLSVISVAVDQNTFEKDLSSELDQIIATSAYGPLTEGGLESSAAALANSSAVQSALPDTLYAISSAPSVIYEDSGTVTFTIKRTNATQNVLVYVSTVPDLGIANPSQDYYYQGLKNIPVSFAVGNTIESVQLNVIDLGLTTGNESFRLIVQAETSDPTSAYLATDTFTINNNDPLLGAFQITPNTDPIDESAGTVWFKITRTDASRSATVYASTVHDQNPLANPGGNYYYQGILNKPITFGVGQLTTQIPLTVSDLGLSSGSETFRLIIQKSPTDSIFKSLASTTFAIVNDDGPVGSGGTTVAPSLVVQSQPLLLESDTTASITPSLLLTTDSGYSNPTQLVYEIINQPTYGSLIDNGSSDPVSFSQEDINDGAFQYKEKGTTNSSDGFTYEVIDPGGNHTPVSSFVIEVSAVPSPPPPPQTPQVTISLDEDTGISSTDGVTSDPSLTGTADANSAVVLSEGNVVLGSTTANLSGIWNFSPTGLAQGLHEIKASETNSSGITGFALLSFILDSTPPQTPSAPSLSGNAHVSPVTTPTVSGTTDPSDNAIVELMEGSTTVGGGPSLDGQWHISTIPFTAGTHVITAVAVDQAGNTSSPSNGDTFTVAPPPPGEVVLNDASMIDAGDLTQEGTITDTYFSGTLTEYGPIAVDGFMLSNTSRSQFAYITLDSAWTFNHDVNAVSEYFNGPDELVVPTDGLLAINPLPAGVPSALTDTIDIRRNDNGAFSLRSVDLAPTGDYPTWAIFTGTTAGGSTISETVELDSSQGRGLQTASLTGFNDVTDVKLTSNLGGSAIPTSVEFDNIVLGSPQLFPTPPPIGSLTGPLVLDDETIIAAGEAPLISTDTNIFVGFTTADYGEISSNGFSIADISRRGYSFFTGDSKFDSTNGYYYDGPGIFITGDQYGIPDTILVQRQDSSSFDFSSIALDTFAAQQATSVTFIGTTQDATQIIQTVTLDALQGLQTFDFGSKFADVASIQFSANAGSVQFDSITVGPSAPLGPPAPSNLKLAPLSDTGSPGDGVTEASSLTIQGSGQPGDTVSLLDGVTIAALATVGEDGSWSTTTGQLPVGSHSFTAIQTDSNDNGSDFSSPLEVQIEPPRTLVWLGGSGSNFANELNWNDSSDGLDPAQAPPNLMDTVEFNTNSGGITGSGTVGTVEVGSSGIGLLDVSGGTTIVAGSLGAGVSASDVGQIGLTGAGTELSVTGSAIVADDGTSVLSVLSGATLSAANLTVSSQTGASGVVVVSGAGSNLQVVTSLIVGDLGTGELSVLSGAQLSAANITIGAQSGSTGNVDVEGNATQLTVSGTVTIGGQGSGVFTLGSGTTLTTGGGVFTTINGVFNQSGEVDPPHVVNDGQTNLSKGARTLADISIENSNEYSLQNGAATMYTPLITFDADPATDQGSTQGTWLISNAGTLVLNADTVDASQTIDFSATNAVLEIGQHPDVSNGTITGTVSAGAANVLAGFGAPIENYRSGDKITFPGLTFASDTVNGNVVTLWSGLAGTGTALGSLDFITPSGAADSKGALLAEAQIGTLACFAAGTRVRTDRGQVPVERLSVGDRVVTHDGAEQPVVWIGSRTVDCARHPAPETVWPVRVEAGAFGENVPMRDLWLSPDHAVFVDGVLVPVKLLINGGTIRRMVVPAVTYYHVELPAHDVILAEGLTVESYLDVGDRGNFANTNGAVRLFPDLGGNLSEGTAAVWETRGAAQLVTAGERLATSKRELLMRVKSCTEETRRKRG